MRVINTICKKETKAKPTNEKRELDTTAHVKGTARALDGYGHLV